MKRSDYIKAVAQKGDFTQVSVKAVLEAMEEVVQETLPTEDVTVFKGLTLTTKTYEPRRRRSAFLHRGSPRPSLALG